MAAICFIVYNDFNSVNYHLYYTTRVYVQNEYVLNMYIVWIFCLDAAWYIYEIFKLQKKNICKIRKFKQMNLGLNSNISTKYPHTYIM